MEDLIKSKVVDLVNPKREFMIDLNFLETVSKDERLYPIVKEYVSKLCENSELIYDKKFHQYYATRIIRVKSGEVHPTAN